MVIMKKILMFWLFLAVCFMFVQCGREQYVQPEYLNSNIGVEDRVRDLIDRMSLEEKVGQMCQYVGIRHIKDAESKYSAEQLKESDAYSFYPGLTCDDIEKMTTEGLIGSFLHVMTAEEANYLQSLAMQSRLGIPLLIGIDAIHGNGMVNGCTVYPSPITISSTWSDSLAFEIARQTAMEMRATGSHWTFNPNLDIARDARWGRFGETCGEDTYLVSRMGYAQIKGYQEGNPEPTSRVIACAKHMIAGGVSINGANVAPSDISDRELLEVHLPPYEKAIKDGEVYTVMMAHNELNGVPCHNHGGLMKEIVKGEYGLDGFIVSDWMDIERLVLHGVVENEKEAYIQSVVNGMDMHMHGPGFWETIVDGVKTGRISERRIDEACESILRAKFQLGLFEHPFVDENTINRKIYTDETRMTALETARKGIILLKNDNILPVAANTSKIFLTGLNADNQSLLGDWCQKQPEDNVITVREGISRLCREKNIQFEYFDCGNKVTGHSIPDLSSEAAEAAVGSDMAVVVVGENSLRYMSDRTCGENYDRTTLNLLNNQTEFVKKIKNKGIPTVVVFITGRPLSDEWIAENADGVIWAWEPGCMGGLAIAEILMGRVNPSGKLTATIPRNAGQIQIYYNHKKSHFLRKPFDVKAGPLYDFGFGLSYTDFEYSNVMLSSSELSPGESITASVDVTNAGQSDGDEIVQLYISDIYSEVSRPVKELRGYRRIFLRRGETMTVSFEITPEKLSYYNASMDKVMEKGEYRIMIGTSSRDEDLKTATLKVGKTEYL